MNYGVEVSEYLGKTIGVYGGKFLPFHQGHLNCILKAQSMVDVLFVVVGYDDEYDKIMCESSKVDWVSSKVRERWITKELKNFSNIRVLSHYERRSDDYMNDPSVMESNVDLIFNKLGGKVDFVFSSEVEYEEYFKKYFPFYTKHVILDSDRLDVNISATKIRTNGVYEMWDFLPKAVQEYYVKRVAICGIESAGKSHLVKMLSKIFSTNYVEEYGRLYYEEINGFDGIDQPEDYIDIAVGHTHSVNQTAKESNKILLVDTDLIYTQYFYSRSNNYNHNQALMNLISNRAEKIDTYIYIEPHNYHELDGTRRPVTKSHREENNQYLKDMYKNYGIDLIIVDEKDRNERLEKCVKIIRGEIS